MSEDMLTPEVPEDDPAANAPGSDPAVDGGSVDSPSVIPAERFNGLMARMNADREAFDAERKALENEIERLQAKPKETPVVSEDSGVLEELQAVRQELQRERMDRARAQAIAKHPGAAPLADLIVGDSPESIEQMAALLEQRLAALSPGAPVTDADADPDLGDDGDKPDAPDVPLLGGGQSIDSDKLPNEAIVEAVANKDFAGFLAAAQERAEASAGAALTVG